MLDIPADVVAADSGDSIEHLKRGFAFKKHVDAKKKPTTKVIKLNPDNGKLSWPSASLLASERAINLAKLTAVEKGVGGSKVLASKGALADRLVFVNLSVTLHLTTSLNRLLVLREGRREVAMEFDSEAARDQFARGLKEFMTANPRPGQVLYVDTR